MTRLFLRQPWLMLVLSAPCAFAHNAFESTAIVRLLTDRMEIRMTTGLSTARTIEAKGGDITAFEPSMLPHLQSSLLANADRLFEVISHNSPLVLGRAEVTFDPELETTFLLIYPRPPAGPLQLRANHVSKLPYGGTYLTIQGESGEVLATGLLMAEVLSMEVVVPPINAAPVQSVAPSFTVFLRLGVEHILTGYDHLLFLLGLLIACHRLRTMAGVVTCFTLAHSITLALAALGLCSISGRIVEPLIATSILFIGVENLLRRKEPPGRWALTFGFGLIHGLGFASVLQNIGLGSSGRQLALPLLAFNLGVELGQLGVVLLLLPALWWLHKRPRYYNRGYALISSGVACAGAYWLLQRTLLG